MANTQTQLSMAELQARLDAAEARNAELQAKLTKKSTVTPKASPRTGQISVYGLFTQHPITMPFDTFKRFEGAIPAINEWVKTLQPWELSFSKEESAERSEAYDAAVAVAKAHGASEDAQKAAGAEASLKVAKAQVSKRK